MFSRVGIVGDGAVAAVHADALGPALSGVWSPDATKSGAFAGQHGTRAAPSYEALLASVEAVVVASPSWVHGVQAEQALRAGKAVLVELPPCETAAEARRLADCAAGGTLVCGQTSRYLEPYRVLSGWLREGRLGTIRQVHYTRHMAPRERDWVDDAVLHHALHALDLCLYWFGGVEPVGCAAARERPQDAALLGRLDNGAPVSVSISYSSRQARCELLLVGDRETAATDGFSYLNDLRWDAEAAYRAAVRMQDQAFLEGRGVPWAETVALMDLADRFRWRLNSAAP
ncbi:MAG: Gfo/Idh/MocA family oxidoreductase [Bryobacterales bacterium]|nr:Gfo/Idh/MocA family oxidoreductase [Bryobacterales bacterium]